MLFQAVRYEFLEFLEANLAEGEVDVASAGWHINDADKHPLVFSEQEYRNRYRIRNDVMSLKSTFVPD